MTHAPQGCLWPGSPPTHYIPCVLQPEGTLHMGDMATPAGCHKGSRHGGRTLAHSHVLQVAGAAGPLCTPSSQSTLLVCAMPLCVPPCLQVAGSSGVGGKALRGHVMQRGMARWLQLCAAASRHCQCPTALVTQCSHMPPPPPAATAGRHFPCRGGAWIMGGCGAKHQGATWGVGRGTHPAPQPFPAVGGCPSCSIPTVLPVAVCYPPLHGLNPQLPAQS